jgi:tetratricopeptide (TPR) repeat protein
VPGDIDRRPLERELERIRETPSVKLFLMRSNIELTPVNVHTVTAICRKLSGLPLAIELIAAFAKINPPTDTLKFLETSGFLALKNTRRDAQKRHQTISQAIESSYRQLSEQEKQLFRQLAVFTGGFSKKAAQEVCASADGSEFDITAGLTALLELSLLKQKFLNGEPRFTMLEPIRAFGFNELESRREMSVLRAAHARYFIKLAEEAEPKLTSRERTPGKWLERLQANHDNFRAVLEWNRETRLLHYESLCLAGSLFWFWNLRAYLSEGRAWLEMVLKQKESDQYPEAKAKALYGAGGLAFLSGDFKAASWYLRKSIKLWEQLGAKRQLGYALIIAGMVAIDRIHYKHARTLLQRSVDIFNSEVDDKWGRALALNDLGRVFMAQAKFKEGEHYFERSLAIWRELEDDWGQPLTLICLGELAYRQRDFDKALESLEEALRIQQRDDKWGRAGLLKFLGNIYLETGNFKEAAVRYHESLLMHRELGRKQLIAECLEGLARLAREMSKPDQAVYLFSAARRLHREIHGYPQKDDFNIFQQYQDQLKSHIGEAAFRVANNKGETDSLEKLLKVAIDFAESVGA